MYPCSPHSCNRSIRSYSLSSGKFRPCPINKEEQLKLTNKNKKLQNKTKTAKNNIKQRTSASYPPNIRPISGATCARSSPRIQTGTRPHLPDYLALSELDQDSKTSSWCHLFWRYTIPNPSQVSVEVEMVMKGLCSKHHVCNLFLILLENMVLK